MSLTHKIIYCALVAGFIGVCLVAVLEALRGFDEDGFYE